MNKLKLLIPPPLITLISAIIIWGLARLVPSLQFFFYSKNILALLLVIFGAIFGLLGIKSFKRHGTTRSPTHPEKSSKLITSGVYKVSRNPMYFGILLVLLGLAVYMSNILSLFGVLFFITYITQFQIKPEEKSLEKKYGQAYNRYKKNTRRWM